MTLTLRAKALGKKLTLILTSFTLAVSSLTAAVPFILSENVSAVADAVYSSNTLTGWTTDRTYPTGGYTVESFAGRQAMRLGVDASKASANSFYRYEGVKTSIGQKDSIQASLYGMLIAIGSTKRQALDFGRLGITPPVKSPHTLLWHLRITHQ